MSFTLLTGSTLKGKAGTATAITYTVLGDAATATTDAFQVLGQGQLSSSTGDLLTTTPVPASTSYIVKEIQMANTTGSDVAGVTFYVNGTAAGNQINGGMTIPANGSAAYRDGEWVIYSSTGQQLVTIPVVAAANVSGLGTAATKNVGNTVLDPGTGKLEFAIPSAGLVTGASKTYASTDRGYVYRRSNSGSAMTDTLPALTNTTADIGYTIGIYNEDTVVAATLTLSASGGALFRSATGSTSATSPINYGCRQQFIWDGTQWLLYAGNANLLRRSGTIVAGNFPQFVDTNGNATIDSGVSAATVNSKVGSVTSTGNTITVTGTTTTNVEVANQAQATFLGRAAAAGTGAPTALTAAQAKTALAIASSDVSGLAASATTDTTNAGNIGSGTLSAGRLPALTGDVTTTAGTVATSIAANAVTNAQLAATMPQATFKGRAAAAGTGNPVDLTAAQAKTALAIAAADVSGLAASATTDTTNAGNISAGTLSVGRLPTPVIKSTDTGTVTNTMLSTMAAHTYKGNNTGSLGTALDLTQAQLTADLNAATTALQGMMSAADKTTANNAKLHSVNLADYNPDSTGATSSVTAITNAMAALPAGGGVVIVPTGTYLIDSTITITGYITFRGTTRSNTVFTTNMPTNDMFLVGQWFVGFENITFQGQSTTVAAGSNGAASSAGTLNVASTTGFPASGTISVTLSTGVWITLTYTGLSGGNQFTGVTGGNATTVATGALIIGRTGGYAINAPTTQNYTQVINCRFQYMYNCVLNGALLMSMQEIEMRNFVNVGIAVSGSSDRYFRQIVSDNAIQAASAIQVTQCGAILMVNCDLIHSGNTLDIAPGAGVTVPSIKATNCFFDNGITGVRMVSAGSWYRSTFVNCWMSSMSTAGVLMGPTTAGNNVDGISFIGCDIYQNVGGTTNGISVTTANVGKWAATGCRIAGWTNGVNIIAGTNHYPQINGCQIGSVSAFGVNTTGITVGAGTYAGLLIMNTDLSGNTTTVSLGAVTVTTWSQYRIADNTGWNPHGAVTTPALPAINTAVTNQTGHRVTVYGKAPAAATTVFTVNGVALGASIAAQTVSIPLDPGGTVAFSVLIQSWVWVGN